MEKIEAHLVGMIQARLRGNSLNSVNNIISSYVFYNFLANYFLIPALLHVCNDFRMNFTYIFEYKTVLL